MLTARSTTLTTGLRQAFALAFVAVSFAGPLSVSAESWHEGEWAYEDGAWVKGLCEWGCDGYDYYCGTGLECQYFYYGGTHSSCDGGTNWEGYYCVDSSGSGGGGRGSSPDESPDGDGGSEDSAFSWEGWYWSSSNQQWVLPQCHGGCDGYDQYCESGTNCQYLYWDSSVSGCSGNTEWEGYYCVP